MPAVTTPSANPYAPDPPPINQPLSGDTTVPNPYAPPPPAAAPPPPLAAPDSPLQTPEPGTPDYMRYQIALKQHQLYGTPMPVNQFYQPRTTFGQDWQDFKSAVSDPGGLGANALQGATFHAAGWIEPEIKQRAEAYAIAHPTAARLSEMAGGIAPALVLGPLGSTAVGGIAGGVESYSDLPKDISTPEAIARVTGSTLLGATLGHYTGKYLMPEASSLGSSFAKEAGVDPALLPQRAPVFGPALTGVTKLGGALALGHHQIPYTEFLGPYGEQMGAWSLGTGGLKDLYTAGKNFAANIGSRTEEATSPQILQPPTSGPGTRWIMNRGPAGQYTGRTFTMPPPPGTAAGRYMQMAFPQGVAGQAIAVPGVQKAQPEISDLAHLITHLPEQIMP